MEAGKLRHRVAIKKLTVTQDSTTGEMTEGWTTFDTVWAAIEPLSVKEFIAAAATQSQVTARITIRYRTGILPSMRIDHGGKLYNILGVLSDKESGMDYLTLPCSEVVE